MSAVSVSCLPGATETKQRTLGGVDTTEVWASIGQVMSLSGRLITYPTKANTKGLSHIAS